MTSPVSVEITTTQIVCAWLAWLISYRLDDILRRIVRRALDDDLHSCGNHIVGPLHHVEATVVDSVYIVCLHAWRVELE